MGCQVASWGGYSFIINLLPIHCLACIFTGRLTPRLYVAYAPLIVIGTLVAGTAPRSLFQSASSFRPHPLRARLLLSRTGQYRAFLVSPKLQACSGPGVLGILIHVDLECPLSSIQTQYLLHMTMHVVCEAKSLNQSVNSDVLLKT